MTNPNQSAPDQPTSAVDEEVDELTINKLNKILRSFGDVVLDDNYCGNGQTTLPLNEISKLLTKAEQRGEVKGQMKAIRKYTPNGEPVKWNVSKQESKQAITTLIQQAEIKARIDEIMSLLEIKLNDRGDTIIYSVSPYSKLVFERIKQLEAQKKEEV